MWTEFRLQPLLRRLSAPGFGLALALSSALGGMALTGCAEDPKPEYSCFMSISTAPLTPGFGSPVRGTVTILDATGSPTEVGTLVRVFVPNPPGVTVSGQARFADVSTDAVGVAAFTLSVDETVPVAPINVFAFIGESTEYCVAQQKELQTPPEGNWSLRIGQPDGPIDADETVQLTLTGLQGDDSTPIPNGTQIQISINSDSGPYADLVGAGITDTKTYTVQGNGEIDFSISLADAETLGDRRTITIDAAFVQSAYGDSKSTSLLIGDAPARSCFANFQDPTIQANGSDITALTLIVVGNDGDDTAAARVTGAITLGTFVDAAGTPAGATFNTLVGQQSQLEYRVQAPNSPGVSGFTATVTFRNDGDPATPETTTCQLSRDLTFLAKPDCTFKGVSPEALGVDQSGFNETGNLTFCFTQADGIPLPEGEIVNFRLNVSTTDSSLSGSSATTDAQGCATIQLSTGSVAGFVEAEASYAFGTSSSSCTSGAVKINGYRPSERGMTMTCQTSSGGENVGALFESDDGAVSGTCPLTCEVRLRDRYTNPVTTEWPVYFVSEMGIIESPAISGELGKVITTFLPNGSRPRDVEPLPTEPRYYMPLPLDEVRNPRDMVVSVIAWTIGEEGFNDSNGNGRYDEGEVFYDLAEPFVDNNDNGIFDPEEPNGERFIDANLNGVGGNGTWDPPNGVWDAYTIIWTEAKVVLTGAPIVRSIADYGGEPDPADPRNANIYPEAFSYYLINSNTFSPFTSVDDIDGIFSGGLNYGDPTSSVTLAFYPRDLFLNPVNDSLSTEMVALSCAAMSIGTPTYGTVVDGIARRAGFKWGRRLVPVRLGDPVTGPIASYVYQPYISEFAAYRPDGVGGDYRQFSNFQATPLVSTTDEPEPFCLLGATHSLGADNGSCTIGVEIPNTLPISR